MTAMRLLCFLMLFLPAIAQAQPMLDLMPVPRNLQTGTGALSVDTGFTVGLAEPFSPRMEKAALRLLRRLNLQTGLMVPEVLVPAETAMLVLRADQLTEDVQDVREDESYALTVTAENAELHAPTEYGVLRGIETFLQLVAAGPAGFEAPAVTVNDAPRFPWRGLNIDACRHWQPVEVIKRNLDAMAAVKLNVLHWHLSEDQGFRVESKVFPKLHQFGSDGLYYTQDEIRDVVQYAADQGIRVVPEFDVPGHTTAWFVGHPELASAPGPYEVERGWGVFKPTMDPTKEEVYDFLDTFFGEMIALFPDSYFHIGGDEVEGSQWNENPEIVAFKAERGWDNHDLQAHFNQRLQEILTKHGKRMVGWDEIFHPDLPNDIVIQSWRGTKALAEAAQQGYSGILSNGFYLDHVLPASFLYSVDPLGGEAANLPPEAQARVLGGEACMWGEYISRETIDSRIWPRLAVVAERLWSPAEVNDVADMYRRLERTSVWLDQTTDVIHRANYEPMLRRLTNGADPAPLRVLADVVEPVKYLDRYGFRKYTQQVPLNRLVDAARPESDEVRRVNALVEAYLAERSEEQAAALRDVFTQWRDHRADLLPLIRQSFLLQEVDSVSAQLVAVAEIGLAALEQLETGAAFTPEAQASHLKVLDTAATPRAEVLLKAVKPVKKLVEAAKS